MPQHNILYEPLVWHHPVEPATSAKHRGFPSNTTAEIPWVLSDQPIALGREIKIFAASVQRAFAKIAGNVPCAIFSRRFQR